MSDSECDLLQNNCIQHESSTISVKGPNVNKTLTNLNFGRNKMLTSTMLMPQNIERSGLGEHSQYVNKSPMSIRTNDSNTSMRAVDIAKALKEGQFNKYDLRIIKEAYHHLVKSRMRRKIEKKRKRRFRSNRRNSYDSGDQGSDSSVSSVECKSLKTASFRDNMSSCRSTRTDISNLKNTMKESNIYRDCTNILKQNAFRNTVSTSSQSVHGDYTIPRDSHEPNTLKNTFSSRTKSVNGDFGPVQDTYERQSMFRNKFTSSSQSIHGDYRAPQSGYRNSQFKAPRSVCSDTIRNKPSLPVLKDRFKNSFLLPSHRFNKSVASLTIPENTTREPWNKSINQSKSSTQLKTAKVNKSLQMKPVTSSPTDSDEDDMFPQITQSKENQRKNRKRSLDEDESNKTPNKKKKDNMSPADKRSITSNDFISNLKNTMKESNIYRDCTNILKQNSFRNTVSTSSRSVHGDYTIPRDSHEPNTLKNTFSSRTKSVNGDFGPVQDTYERRSMFRNKFTSSSQSIHGDYRAPQSGYRNSQFKAPRSVCSDTIRNKPSLPVLKDRFKNSFLLPSHRFNKSVASLTIPENTTREPWNKSINQSKSSTQLKTAKVNKSLQMKPVTSSPTDSDEDDMFPQITQSKENQRKNRKRSLDEDESNKTPNKKKKDNMSPKNNLQIKVADERTITSNDFRFIKPTLPVKKSLSGKPSEIIIARSAVPGNFDSPPAKTNTVSTTQQEEQTNTNHSDTSNDKQAEISQNSSADVSSRPSFIRRKLFSQKLDVTEARDKTDSSSESPQVDSYKSLMREKTKARKLVINNSCLNRDISGVNNNLLDLIHKIVPAEQMNMTNVANQTNKTEVKNTTEPEDKWDVTSVISTCNNKDNVSDTFTDDELFCFTIRTNKKEVKTKAKDVKPVNQAKKVSSKTSDITPCKVVVKALSKSSTNKVIEEKKISFSCVDNFFDTDYETDSESMKVDKQPTPNPMSKVGGSENLKEKKKEDLKSSTNKVNTTKEKPDSKNKSKINKPKKPTDANESMKSTPTDQDKVNGSNKLDKSSKTQTISKNKEKKKEPIEKTDNKQKKSKTVQKKNNEPEKKIPPIETLSNEQQTITSLNKDELSKDKPKHDTNAKIQDNDAKETDKNKHTNKTNSMKEPFFNNSRSRRIRTPRSQKENIPINNIRTRSGNKSNKKMVSTKTSETKQRIQDSFTLLENNNNKNTECKTNKEMTKKPDEDSLLSTSMTLRSRSFQESDEISKANKNAKNTVIIGDSNRRKDSNIKNPITKIRAKIQNLCNTSMSLRTRKNSRKDISYVY